MSIKAPRPVRFSASMEVDGSGSLEVKNLNSGSSHQELRARGLVRIGRRPPKPIVEGSNPPGPATQDNMITIILSACYSAE
jgi:hypothetical protein